MRKVLVALVFTLITLCGYSQQRGQDYITKKADGKVYWMRGGKNIKMAIDVPLSNGSKVNYKGVITGKDGETTELQPGDRVLMDGTLVKPKS